MVWPIVALAGKALVGAVAGKVVGAVAGGGGSSGGVDTQAYGVKNSPAQAIAATTGLMSAPTVNSKDSDEFKVASAYQGRSPWEHVDRVNSWFKQEED